MTRATLLMQQNRTLDLVRSGSLQQGCHLAGVQRVDSRISLGRGE